MLAKDERNHNKSRSDLLRLEKQILIQERISPDFFNGTAEIRDEDLIITPPRGFGKYPIVMAGEHVEIYENGQKVEHPVIVYDRAAIDIRILHTSPKIEIDVQLSSDRLSAYVTIKRIPGQKYKLMDCQPMNEIKINVQCIEEVEPDFPKFEDILQKLQEQGIVFGINENAIKEAIQSPQREVTFVAARGIEPTESKDATIVYNLGNDEHSEFAKDPFGDGKIHSVSEGEIVAIKRPPVWGRPGVDVTGQRVLPRKPVDIPIRIKDGVKLIQEGNVAVATRAGRPVLEGFEKKYLSVRPVYIVEGDVDLHVGNLDFNGDIVITGNVLDGFTVKSGGQIQVYGDVLHATLYANGDIIVSKKVITSRLQAGGSTVSYKNIHRLLKELSLRLDKMMEAIQLIKNQPAFSTLDLAQKGEGQLIQLLIDYKFKDIPQHIYRLIDIVLSVDRETILPDVVKIVHLLSKNLCNLGPLQIQGDGELNFLKEKVDHTLEQLDLLITDSANIVASYVQNSSLIASGDITITGQGIITSHVEAGGKISVARGVVRGGELAAKDRIQVFELGSSQDAEVYVRLMDKCTLEAHLARPSIRIQHGSQIKTVQEFRRNLKAFMNGDLFVTAD